MDENKGDISSDSDFGDSWTIIDKHSFCNRMMDAINVFEEYSDLSNSRDCALNFQDDSNNDADADSDGISVISESEDHHNLMDPEFSYIPTLQTKLPTPPSSPEPNEHFDTLETNIRTIQAGTRTPKKNKAKCNKPLTPPNTPVDCECPVSEKPEKKHKKRSYIHNRNDKVSNILNILLAGTIATAAGLALGHLMGSKSECSNLTAGVSNELTLKQLQYENYKLKNELQDLKRESLHINNRFNKYSANTKSRRNMTNNGLSKNNSKYDDHNLEQNLTDNNAFPSSQPKSNSVFYGPKTYAETITYQRQKFDEFCDNHETILIDTVSETQFENKNLEKSNSLSDITQIEEIVSMEEPIQDQNDTRNQSFPNLQYKTDTESVKDTNQTSDNKEKQSVTSSENHKSNKKNSKTKSNTGSKDHETENIAQSNVKNEKNSKSNNKLKRKSNNKDYSSCKKSRSPSSGKESGDFDSNKLSNDEKSHEKTNELENEKIQDDLGLEQQQYKNRKSQKCAKKDHKQKDKSKNKKLAFEHEIKINEKDDEHKYPENESSQKHKSEQKKNVKKEKKHEIDINKNDHSLSQHDIKTTNNKDRKNNEKFLKTHQKDDRRKSDYKHESKDKYDDWEKNKGYEYYLSQDDVLLDGLSEDESYNKASDKIIFSSEEPVYPKIKIAKSYKEDNIDFDSQNNNWSFLPLAETSDNNSDKMDSSWVDDVAKYREEQRNKQKESDWLFERAKIREMKRDKASWYFNRMNEREQCRAQEKDKHTSKRSNKKSPNYRSKL